MAEQLAPPYNIRCECGEVFTVWTPAQAKGAKCPKCGIIHRQGTRRKS